MRSTRDSALRGIRQGGKEERIGRENKGKEKDGRGDQDPKFYDRSQPLRPSVRPFVCIKISLSFNAKFVGRHYTTRPGVLRVVSGKQ